MFRRLSLLLPLVFALSLVLHDRQPAYACCPAPPPNKVAANADQTIVILWDPVKKIEHFIRKATFQSDADDFGFLVPSPTQPELSESGNLAFPLLATITEPELIHKTHSRESRFSCVYTLSNSLPVDAKYAVDGPEVRVLEEKFVAGFKASVLEADTTGVLLEWLKTNGYAFSPAVEAWAAPYVANHWKITALKVAKDPAHPESRGVAARSLRMSFHTDQPLFPYREPDSSAATNALNLHRRLLRIFFIGDARYQGKITSTQSWTGNTVWSNPLAPEQRTALLNQLTLPQDTGPETFWLTEFEDPWPYRQAEADLIFSKDLTQNKIKRHPIVIYDEVENPIDLLVFAGFGLSFLVAGVWTLRWLLRRNR